MAREKVGLKMRKEEFKFPEISEMERRLNLARKVQNPKEYEKDRTLAVKVEKSKEYAMPANFIQVRKDVEKEFAGGIKELAKQLKIKL